jgi:hypothetical protein
MSGWRSATRSRSASVRAELGAAYTSPAAVAGIYAYLPCELPPPTAEEARNSGFLSILRTVKNSGHKNFRAILVNCIDDDVRAIDEFPRALTSARPPHLC